MKFCHCRHLNMQMSSTVGYVLSSIAITNTSVRYWNMCALSQFLKAYDCYLPLTFMVL